MPLTFTEALESVIKNSGPKDGQRFMVTDGLARAGTLHPLSNTQRAALPLPVVVVVMNVTGEKAHICPALVPLHVDPRVLPEDRWLPSDHSPFRVLPGTGTMQIRVSWALDISVHLLNPAFRQIPWSQVVLDRPAEVEPALARAMEIVSWKEMWEALFE